MTRAEDLFKRIEVEGIKFIHELINDRQSEELFLDFKRSRVDGRGERLDPKDQSKYRSAVCGFANSEGGIIIWGVDCSNDEENGDVPSKIHAIENPSRFVSWLEGKVSSCTVPPVVGVRSISIDIDEQTGLIATFIPKSSHAPHQLSGESKYLIRAGSDFVPAPHGVVAGLFGKPPQPVVYPNFILSLPRIVDKGIFIEMLITMVNNGNVVAEDLYVSVFCSSVPNSEFKILSESTQGWKKSSAFGVDFSFISPRDFRLAPRGNLIICRQTFLFPEILNDPFSWEIVTGCAHGIPNTRKITVEPSILQKRFNELKNALMDNSLYNYHSAATDLLGITAM